MNSDSRFETVLEFYNTHPINEHEIREKLRLDGNETGDFLQEELLKYDQDHYGGVAATDALASLANVTGATHVLDVGSGMGGPARYLARQYGCRVSGLDLTESRVLGARRLTDLAGLSERIDFNRGNALDMPFEAASFDAVVSQETFLHVPDKATLLSECARVLKPGGRIAFTDILVTDKMDENTRTRLGAKMATNDLSSADTYRELLAGSGFDKIEVRDLSDEWRDILVKRLTMYRSLKEQTIKRFGEDGFRKWDDAYAFFVGLYRTGELGGGRFSATRLAD
ncbi:MAG: methyltransferase domain-containing protein [Pseudomonadota bacterium]